jgi:hypothetical protein
MPFFITINYDQKSSITFLMTASGRLEIPAALPPEAGEFQ